MDRRTISSLNALAELLEEVRHERDDAVRERDLLQARITEARGMISSSLAGDREWQAERAARAKRIVAALEQSGCTPSEWLTAVATG